MPDQPDDPVVRPTGIQIDVWGGLLHQDLMTEQKYADWPSALAYIREMVEAGCLCNVLHTDYQPPPGQRDEAMKAILSELAEKHLGHSALTLVDIGDKLRLTRDWTFQLHQESRNHEFAVALGLLAVGTPWDTIMHRIGVVTGKNYYQTRPFPEQERYYFERELRRKHGMNPSRLESTLSDANLSAFDQGTLDLMAAFTLHATIPAGAELTVDRVYIRKGAKDYSSLSFLVTDAAPFGDRLAPVAKRGFKRAHRFWAKLDDCRRISAVLTHAEAAV